MRTEKKPGGTGVRKRGASPHRQPLRMRLTFRFHLGRHNCLTWSCFCLEGATESGNRELTGEPDGVTVGAEEGSEPSRGPRRTEGRWGSQTAES